MGLAGGVVLLAYAQVMPMLKRDAAGRMDEPLRPNKANEGRGSTRGSHRRENEGDDEPTTGPKPV